MKKKGDILVKRKEKEERGIFGDWKKREREREYWEEKKRRKHTEKEKIRHQVCFFPFCLYIHTCHKIKRTRDYSYFINMHLHERVIPQCFYIVFLPCISTVHPTMNLHHLSIPF